MKWWCKWICNCKRSRLIDYFDKLICWRNRAFDGCVYAFKYVQQLSFFLTPPMLHTPKSNSFPFQNTKNAWNFIKSVLFPFFSFHFDASPSTMCDNNDNGSGKNMLQLWIANFCVLALHSYKYNAQHNTYENFVWNDPKIPDNGFYVAVVGWRTKQITRKIIPLFVMPFFIPFIF